jgi:hypothetical protein
MYQNSCYFGVIYEQLLELSLPHRAVCVAPQNMVGVLCVPACVTAESLCVCVCVCVDHKAFGRLPECVYLAITITITNNALNERTCTSVCSSRVFHVNVMLILLSYGMWRRVVWYIATSFRGSLLPPSFYPEEWFYFKFELNLLLFEEGIYPTVYKKRHVILSSGGLLWTR